MGFEYSHMYKFTHRIMKDPNINDDTDFDSRDIHWNNVNTRLSLITRIVHKHMNSLYYKINLKHIAKELKIEKYDLIHAHWTYPTGYIAMLLSKKYNIPYVVTPYGTDIHTIPKGNKDIRKLTIKVLENANKAIFLSQNLKEEALKLGYSGQNSQIIYKGVDSKDFKPLDKEKIKKELGFEKLVVGYIGRLETVKGADKLPLIFYELSKRRSDVEFIIVGQGSLKDSIIKKLNDLNIKYKYYKPMKQKELNKYMNLCDVIVVPSRDESFGCVPLEAQSCGTKVVASNVGGIPECVGDFGFLVDLGEEFEKRFAIEIENCLFIQLDTKSMISRANGFTWQNEVEEEVKVYASIIHS
ncbi:D-inositol-3-phosphate glycosyltransferase [Terrisporobacter petrolearius]|uniref:D-inositol-3-phosphate glycosyltransferase n=2 Tax=Terrisporobacter petrolearius TaxID=1460447 RepID=A0ABZ3FBW3_9FIRM